MQQTKQAKGRGGGAAGDEVRLCKRAGKFSLVKEGREIQRKDLPHGDGL